MEFLQKWPKRTLWYVITALLLLNCITLVTIIKMNGSNAIETFGIAKKDNDIVAKVGDVDISTNELIVELEKRYGATVLQEMINKQVISNLAKKYNITVSDKDVDREWNLIKTIYQHNANFSSEEDMKEHIRTSLQMEELLVKDVVIAEDEMKKYYEENRSLYNIPETFHLSHIVLGTKEEANQVVEELKEGSSISALAMEKSQDELSANQGGDIGYISKEYSGSFPEVYITEASKLKKGNWSKPFELNGKYIILYLHEKIDATNYSFKEVKDQVRRMLALEQIETSVRVEMFWNEAEVEWQYNEKNK